MSPTVLFVCPSWVAVGQRKFGDLCLCESFVVKKTEWAVSLLHRLLNPGRSATSVILTRARVYSHANMLAFIMLSCYHLLISTEQCAATLGMICWFQPAVHQSSVARLWKWTVVKFPPSDQRSHLSAPLPEQICSSQAYIQIVLTRLCLPATTDTKSIGADPETDPPSVSHSEQIVNFKHTNYWF